MRRWTFTLLALVLATGCWEKRVKRLNANEFNHYYALRPFMNEDVRKEFLKAKTEEERNAVLKKHSPLGTPLWDMFYQYSEYERDAIVGGEVAVGWTRDRVLMAWGTPFDKRKLVGRPAVRSEMLVYRFEVAEDGAVMVWVPDSKTSYHALRRFERRVIVDDNHVAEIEESEGWE